MKGSVRIGKLRTGGLLVALLAGFGGTAASAAVNPDSGPETGGSQVQVDGPAFTQVSIGERHSLAIAADGTVWAWGGEDNGTLGTGALDSSPVPVPVDSTPLGARTITNVAAGFFHSLAVASDGTVWAWGQNFDGQLGNGTFDESPAPVQVDATGWGARTITTVTACSQHSVALASDGTLWAWGRNSNRVFGNGTTNSSNVPVQVDGTPWGARTIIGIDCSDSRTTALASDGTVWVWGANGGSFGDGTFNSSAIPVQVDSTPWGSRTITSISTVERHSLAVASDGTVWAWGENGSGQLGNGGFGSALVPVQVDSTPWGTRTITNIAAGGRYSLAVASDGTVWAWGANPFGQLGIGTATDDFPVPEQVDTTAWAPRTITDINASSGANSVALASDGTIWTWGSGSGGQLGNGTSDSDSVIPTQSGWTISSVFFDGIPGTDLSVGQAGAITVTTPAHAPGAVDVTVETLFVNGQPGPTFTTAQGFTYLPPVEPPVITTTALPEAQQGNLYSMQLAATGQGPITWAVTSGDLPAGLTFDPNTGLISGTPTAAETVSITFTATNPGGTTTATFTLTVTAAPDPTTEPTTTHPIAPAATPTTGGQLATTGLTDGLSLVWWSVAALILGVGAYATGVRLNRSHN